MQCEISEAIGMALSDPVKVNRDPSVCLLHTTNLIKAHLQAFLCVNTPISLSIPDREEWPMELSHVLQGGGRVSNITV